MAAAMFQQHPVGKVGLLAYRCDVCLKQYSTLSSLSRHKNVHYHPMRCTTCNKDFAEIRHYNRHLHTKQHHQILTDSVINVATLNDTQTKSMERLSRSSDKRHHDDLSNSININDEIPLPTEFREEYLGFKNVILCLNQVESPALLARAAEKKRARLSESPPENQANVESDKFCENEFGDIQRTIPHDLLCQLCGKPYEDSTSETEIAQHFETKHSKDPYYCHLCGNDYKNTKNLNQHLKKTKHINSLVRFYKIRNELLDGINSSIC